MSTLSRSLGLLRSSGHPTSSTVAFDMRSAGAALFGPGLKTWLAQRPGLAPLAPQIESFFAGTQRGFFEVGAPLPPTAEVLALCRRLAQAEGRGA